MIPVSATTVAAVLRASRREAALVHEDLKVGVNGLATVACVAPWFGLFATVWSIPSSFVGCGGEKSTCMAATVDLLSGSMWPTALGLLTGIVALWSYRYLSGMLDLFDIEMEGASLDLINQLTQYRLTWASQTPIRPQNLFAGWQEQPWRHATAVGAAALLLSWLVGAAIFFFQDAIPMASTAWPGLKHAVLMLGLSAAPMHLLWVRVLRCKPGLWTVLVSGLCLLLCLTELVLGVHLF